MISPKYYIEIEEEATYPDSSCNVFYADQPFDTLEEAKRAADEAIAAFMFSNRRAVYECRDNILTPVSVRWGDDPDWIPYT